MTTETEMQRIIGSALWVSGKMFVGNMPLTPGSKTTERDHAGLIAKMVDGSEFKIIIQRVR